MSERTPAGPGDDTGTAKSSAEAARPSPEADLKARHAARARSAARRAAAISHHIGQAAPGDGGGPGTDTETGSGTDTETGSGPGPGTGGNRPEPGGAPGPADDGSRQNTAWQAAHAARVCVQALAVLAESAPDPAADSRCARNAAASAAQAARMGQRHDGDGAPAEAACRAAVRASQAAAAAAGRSALGRDEALNTAADTAEADAVTAAEQAGWLRPGQVLPELSTGLRSPELMSMMHF
ncbi:hypothetical protein [Streptomyces sp. NPDC002564]|uniref:hypothetical protein n=1 Tax=Streptomyces sp. NPDC002564 TaxID=3364649 RepID=UPI0036B8FDA6